jgi:hypothetical protein
MASCPNRHENSGTLGVCSTCGLPLVDVQEGFDFLTRAMAARSVLARSKAQMIVAGVGPFGARIVTSLRRKPAKDPQTAHVTLDMPGSENNDAADSEPFFSLRVGGPVAGSSVFCGRCEEIAEGDTSVSSLASNAGIREVDENQAIVLALSLGEGPGSGVAPVFLKRSYSFNPRSSAFAVAVLPATNDSLHSHINAFYGLSRLVGSTHDRGVDAVIALDYDRLRKVRGVGLVGEELKMETLVESLTALLAITLSPPNASRFASMSRWMRTPLLVPCLGLGHSLEIFGSLDHILESCIAYPLCSISPDDVIVSEVLLKIPRQLAGSFPEAMLAEDIASFNQHHFRNVKASLFKASFVEQEHDRIDACILLGAKDLTNALANTTSAFQEFRDGVTDPEQWHVYGLDEGRIAAAERTMAALGRTPPE